MKFLLLICDDEAVWDALPPAEQKTIIDGHIALARDLRQRGQYLAGEALQPAATARTVRKRRDQLGVTDGPIAEVKEQIGGFYLIEARDQDEAVAIAGRIPTHGCVEVRPVLELG